MSCVSCHGCAIGCPGNADGSNCPWGEQSANARRLNDPSNGEALRVTGMLPNRVIRIFSTCVLNMLALVHKQPRDGSTPDLTSMSADKLCKTVMAGLAPKQDVILEILGRLQDSSASEATKALMNQTLKIVSALQPSLAAQASAEGAFLYILSKLSVHICTEIVVHFDLCVTIQPEDHEGGSTSTSNKRFSPTLRRPHNMQQMFALLSHFTLVSHATGIGNTLVMLPFLDDVVYEPVRTGSLIWAEAFELVLVYLRRVENEPSVYRLSNVVSLSGGMDTLRAEAKIAARKLYPAAIFRAHGGNPEQHGGDRLNLTGSRKASSFSAQNKQCCVAWNSATSLEAAKSAIHFDKHLGTNGKCKFNHACSQWVTGKGKMGQCGATDHTRAMGCTNPNKCDEPVQA